MPRDVLFLGGNVHRIRGYEGITPSLCNPLNTCVTPKKTAKNLFVNTAIIYNSGTNKEDMEENEFLSVLSYLYEKTLILQDPGQFNKVLYFYLVDSLAHIDYTAGIYAFNILSPKNIMGGEYLRWRIDEEKKGDRAKFPGFITWLKENRPERFARLPSLWQMIYDAEDPAGYRSFRIVLDPDSRNLLPIDFFYVIIDEFFEPEFLKSLYEDASLSTLFKTYSATC